MRGFPETWIDPNTQLVLIVLKLKISPKNSLLLKASHSSCCAPPFHSISSFMEFCFPNYYNSRGFPKFYI